MEQPLHMRPRIGRALGIVTLAALATYGSCVLPVFYEELKAYFGIGSGAYGLMLSIGSLGSVMAALAGGVLVDRRGPRRVIRWCLLGLGASLALMALCGRVWALMAAGIGVAALFQSTCYLAVNAYLVRDFPDNKRRMLALSSVAASAAGIVFPLLGEGLLTLKSEVPAVNFSLTLHVPFAVLALALLTAGVVLRTDDRRQELQAAARPWTWRDVRLPWRTLALVLLAALHAAVDTTLFLWMPGYLLSGAFAEQSMRPGWVLSAYGAAYLVSRVALMFVRESTGRRAFLVLPGLLGGGTMIAGLLSRDYTTTAVCYVLGGLLWSVEFPTILSLIAEESGPRFGTAGAMVSLGMAVGTFLLLNQTGWLVGRLGPETMWMAMLIPALGFPGFALGAAAWLWIYRSRRPQAPPADLP